VCRKSWNLKSATTIILLLKGGKKAQCRNKLPFLQAKLIYAKTVPVTVKKPVPLLFLFRDYLGWHISS